MFKKKSIGISNDNKKNKKIIIISAVSAVFVLAIIVLLTTGGLSKLMGNSVTEYYCEDPSYKLEGDKCVKEIREKSAFLGDVNLDNKITNEDLNLIQRYINYAEYDEPDEEVSKLKPIQIKAADVSEDNDVYNLDYDILNAYLGANASTHGISEENIGAKRICADNFTLDGIDCVKKDIVDAKVKSATDESPVEVSFKPENESTDIEANKLYKINVKFDVKDKTKQYYYIWKTYKYGKNDFSTECKAVNEGENSGNFIMDGTKKVNVSVYSDSECKNQVATQDSKTYKCVGCSEGIDVSIISESDETFLKVPYSTDYKLKYQFKINDDEHKYYYIWSTYLNGENDYNTECEEATQGIHEGSFKADGYRQVKIAVYSDSACKNKVKEVESKNYASEYHLNVEKGYVYPTARAWLEPIKIRYRDNVTGKVTEETNIKNITKVPYNSEVVYKIHFFVDKSMPKMYYTWYHDKTYHWNKDKNDKCLPVPKSLSDTVVLPMDDQPRNFSSYPADIILEYGQANLYSDSNCSNRISSYEQIITKHYYYSTYTVNINANGGTYRYIDINSMNNFKVYVNSNFKLNVFMYKNGYDLIGYKAKNSKGQYVCYTNSKKTTKAFANQATCNKYGYYIYGPDETIVSLAPAGEKVTFIAQWTNNPVTINVSNLKYSSYKAKTVVNSKTTIKVNDTKNQYYYRWLYLKDDASINSDLYKSISHFVKKYDPYSYTNQYYEGNLEPRRHLSNYWKYGTSCKKVTNNVSINTSIRIDKAIDAGMVVIYKDRDCFQEISSIMKIHKITGLYKCSINDINSRKC